MTSQGQPTFENGRGGRPKRKKVIVFSVLAVLVATIAGVLVGVALYRDQHRPFYVPSASMSPTLQVNDRVSTDKLSGEDGIQRGQIVIYKAPPEAQGVQTMIKRVVGLPGETIEARDDVVYVNGAPLPEPYLLPGTITDDLPRTTVPAGHYFFLGDNRENSQDGRSLGPTPREDIEFHATSVIFPVDRRTDLP